MKKYLISGFISVALIGCSSPPKPPKLQSDNYHKIESNALLDVNNIDHEITPSTAIFSDKNLHFYKSVSIKSDSIDELPDDLVQPFTFLVAHSDTIIIAGTKKNIDTWAAWLNTVNPNINIESIILKHKNNNFIDFSFFKNYSIYNRNR